MDFTLKKIIKEISKELDVDIDVVTKVVKIPFKFITLKMRENLVSYENPTISLRYLGKFGVKKKRQESLELRKASKVDEVMEYIKTQENVSIER